MVLNDFMSYFSMKKMPFTSSIGTYFLFRNDRHADIRNKLLLTIQSDAMALLTGRPGTGKSTILRSITSTLSPEQYLVLYVSISNPTPRWLYTVPLQQLGVKSHQYVNDARKQFHDELTKVGGKTQGLAMSLSAMEGSYDLGHAYRLMSTLVASDDMIFGSGLWFAPGKFPGGEKWFGPYFAKEDSGKVSLTMEYSNEEYNYPQFAWYKAALENPKEVFWDEPAYDPVSKKQLEQLVKTAQFEGYYDEAKEAFDNLEARLNHDVATDLEKYKDVLLQILESEIISAYYYQAGSIEFSLQYDRQVKEAERILKNPDEYKKLLAPKRPKETASLIKLGRKNKENVSLKPRKVEIFSALA